MELQPCRGQALEVVNFPQKGFAGLFVQGLVGNSLCSFCMLLDYFPLIWVNGLRVIRAEA